MQSHFPYALVGVYIYWEPTIYSAAFLGVSITCLQFRLWIGQIHQVLVLRKSVIIVQTFGVCKRPRCLDHLAGHNLLHRQFNLLKIDSGLHIVSTTESGM